MKYGASTDFEEEQEEWENEDARSAKVVQVAE